MIIDSHLHVMFSQSKPWEPLIEQLLHDMSLVGIDQTCIMPFPTFSGYVYPNKEDMIYQAKTLAAITEKYPDRFFPLLLINPILSTDFLKDLAREYILNGPIIGTKYHVAMEADDERADPFYDFLEEHDIPLLFHAWYKTVQKETFESDPKNIAAMAKKHPRLRILMAHLTGVGIRGLYDIKEYPNILLDTCGSQPEEGYLQRAVEILGADRVLYGSDYPVRAFSTQLARIDSVEMSTETKEKILYKNALHFYRKGAL
jgi:predicted TIM-barrel fold metal-dependent hydrolase